MKVNFELVKEKVNNLIAVDEPISLYENGLMMIGEIRVPRDENWVNVQLIHSINLTSLEHNELRGILKEAHYLQKESENTRNEKIAYEYLTS